MRSTAVTVGTTLGIFVLFRVHVSPTAVVFGVVLEEHLVLIRRAGSSRRGVIRALHGSGTRAEIQA